MAERTEQACEMLGPSAGMTEPRKPMRMAGTGATEASAATPIPAGTMGTILVGATAIRFTLRKATGLGAAQVATTDVLLPAYGRFDWMADLETRVPYIEAGDAVSAYEAWAWQSSP